MAGGASEDDVMEPAYVYSAVCDRVIDADTFILEIDVGFHMTVTVPVRLRGIDAPELRTPEGKAAKAWLEAYLVGKQILVETYKDQQTFARWLGDVYVGGQSLVTLLREAGHEKVVP